MYDSDDIRLIVFEKNQSVCLLFPLFIRKLEI